ncbi:MAG: asparagine synthase-related protein [Desulfopila sp.]|nr:asparagine synthase-related protein [Desulfopila sp.]
MTNFIICHDSDKDRRKAFFRRICPLIAPLEGLKVCTFAGNDLQVIWAGNENCPMSTYQTEQEMAIVWGDMFQGDKRLAAKDLIGTWQSTKSYVCDTHDGYHAFMTCNRQSDICVGTDILGLFPLYYYASSTFLLVGSSPELFRYHPEVKVEFNPPAFVGILLTNGLTSNQTMLKGIHRLSAGHVLSWHPGGQLAEIAQYSIPTSTAHFDTPLRTQLCLLHETLSATVSRYKDEKEMALMLSGGLDSRLIAGLFNGLPSRKVAYTMGSATDIDLHCATRVAEYLCLSHKTFSLEHNNCHCLAEIQSRWEHCASGFSNIFSWGIRSSMKDSPPHVMTGFLMDSLMRGNFDEQLPRDAVFQRVFNQDNLWGIAPAILEKLLRSDIFGSDVIKETIQKIRADFEGYSEFDTKRVLWHKLRHRQRYHIGGIIWHLSFASWPVLPPLDRRFLELIGGLPAASLSGKRLQKELLLAYFQALAEIPLDTNSSEPELLRPRLRHLLKKYCQQRLKPFERFKKDWLPGKKIERRHYYRLHDFNGPEWCQVRRLAENYREYAEEFFDMDVFNTILPKPETVISFRNGISGPAGLKILLGFLLWIGGRRITPGEDRQTRCETILTL